MSSGQPPNSPPPTPSMASTPPRHRDRTVVSSTATSKPKKTSTRAVPATVVKFLAGGGTVRRADPSAPAEIITVSSESEGEGPTPMDKDDLMYHGKANKNRVDSGASSSIIRTRAATRASSSTANPREDGNTQSESSTAKLSKRSTAIALNKGFLDDTPAVGAAVSAVKKKAVKTPVPVEDLPVEEAPSTRHTTASATRKKSVRSRAPVEEAAVVPDDVRATPPAPVRGSSSSRRAKSSVAVVPVDAVEEDAVSVPQSAAATRTSSSHQRGSAPRKKVVNSSARTDRSSVDPEELIVDLKPASIAGRGRSSARNSVGAGRSKPVASAESSQEFRLASSLKAETLVGDDLDQPRLYSPPVTPTPTGLKRASSTDGEDDGEASDSVHRRRPKRVRFTEEQAAALSYGVVDEHFDEDASMVDLDDQDLVDDSFDIEHSASDGEPERDDDGYDLSDPFLDDGSSDTKSAPSKDKGKGRAPVSPVDSDSDLPPGPDLPEDDVSFAQAMGLPEEDADVAGDTKVKQEAPSSDKILKKYYVKSLPKLRLGVLTSWSGSKGSGMVAFSDWGVKCPSMKFKTCINIIEFRSSGRFINPSWVSPLDFLVKYMPGYVEKYQLYDMDRKHVICLCAVRSRESFLFSPNPRNGRKLISGVFHSQEWERFVGFICTMFDKEELESQIFQDAIQFSTRPAVESQASSKSEVQSSPTLKLKAKSQSLKDPYSLSSADDIPVYDCRSTIVDFNTDLEDLSFFPRLRGEIPNDSFVVVAHTISVYKSGAGNWSLSLNVLWAMLVGSPRVYRVSRVSDDE